MFTQRDRGGTSEGANGANEMINDHLHDYLLFLHVSKKRLYS